MGCPTSVSLQGTLVFSICTHDPTTLVLSDADELPTYRVYEDETGTAILTGTMSKLDDANTTGFYSEQVECTAANGFEAGKTYTVYIQAVVAGDRGGISYGFQCGPVEETGFGSVAVNHDYGGADTLAYQTAAGAGVEDATVQAFLTTDYDAGNRTSAFMRGATRTTTFGRWERDIMLDPGDYTIVCFKQGEYGPDTAEITVT